MFIIVVVCYSMRTGNIVRCNYVYIYTLLQEIYVTKLGKHIQIQATLGESLIERFWAVSPPHN